MWKKLDKIMLRSRTCVSNVKAEENIFFFIPNIIGYARVVLALVSFYVMLSHPWLACSTYLLSAFLDEFDGRAARAFNQCTIFGAVFDIITDKCAIIGLIVVLAHFYPSWLFYFQLLIALEISSHWVQMYAAVQQGDTSHKVTDPSANPIMRFYYTPHVLSVFCVANDLFFSSLYMLHFTPGFTVPVFGTEVGVWTLVAILSFPIAFMKQCVHVVQLIDACQKLGAIDSKRRVCRSE